MSLGQDTSLKTLLAEGGPLDPTRAVNVVRQVAAAIDDAHSHQTIHQDVRPATILVSGADYAYLAEGGTKSVGLEPLTYQAPELVTNNTVTYRADIFALTAVLYECLTGVPPYRSVTGDTAALIAARLDAPIPQPSQHRKDLPAGFDAVIARGLAKNPAERYPSAAELAAAAQQALTGAPTSNTPSKPTRQTPADSATVELTLPSTAPQQPKRDPLLEQPTTYPDLPTLPSPSANNARRRRWALPVAAGLLVIAAVTAGVIAIPRLTRHHTTSQSAGTATTHTYSSQPTALPFPVLDSPKAMAVGRDGTLYLLSSVSGEPPTEQYAGSPKRLFKLAPGAAGPSTIEIPGLDISLASAIAVDAGNNIYIAQDKNVWRFALGTARPIRLPFRDLISVASIAVDSADNVYIVGTGGGNGVNYLALKLIPGDARPARLPFNLQLPRAITVDHKGDIYVINSADKGQRKILKLAAGAGNPTEVPLAGLKDPSSLAVDGAGGLFVADMWAGKVFELQPGATDPAALPQLTKATAVSVDAAGNVYVCTTMTKTEGEQMVLPGQVLKYAPDS
ncbi:serine/threonine-protein kinase [Mycobacterium vicinigordonae]|uniref:non-specific serine/threonine protein kinase n=1 Tax=Mycobacterium vicinigordonae TaxID=1719132 RepID=A0A7D6E1U8_9MYCO|nr:serine/threonine-protein kinase [Mycobacterium vicinigordonae]QLL09648.1 protein kinase [Mycobacterium vicinigordonae]